MLGILILTMLCNNELGDNCQYSLGSRSGECLHRRSQNPCPGLRHLYVFLNRGAVSHSPFTGNSRCNRCVSGNAIPRLVGLSLGGVLLRSTRKCFKLRRKSATLACVACLSCGPPQQSVCDRQAHVATARFVCWKGPKLRKG